MHLLCDKKKKKKEYKHINFNLLNRFRFSFSGKCQHRNIRAPHRNVPKQPHYNVRLVWKSAFRDRTSVGRIVSKAIGRHIKLSTCWQVSCSYPVNFIGSKIEYDGLCIFYFFKFLSWQLNRRYRWWHRYSRRWISTMALLYVYWQIEAVSANSEASSAWSNRSARLCWPSKWPFVKRRGISR